MTSDGRRGATVAYGVLAGLVVMGATVATLHGEWVSDSWIHLAAIHEMSRDFWSPVEPLVGENVPFPYFSPWTAVGALAVRALSVAPQNVLAVFGIVSPLLLVHALFRLTRAVSPAPWAPVAVLAAFLTVWGSKVFFWSGFLSLTTLVVGSSWPSVLATALWFYLWASVWTSTRMTRGLVAALVIIPGLLLLIHPFTFISAATACAVTVLLRWPRRRWLGGTLAALASVGLAALWPWTSLLDLLSNPRGFDAFHTFFYRDIFAKFGLLLLTVPAVALRLWRRRSDALAWSAIAGVGIWVAGGLLDVESLGRVLPLATTAATMALGIGAAEAFHREGATPAESARRDRALLPRVALVSTWILAVGLGSLTQANAWSRVTFDEEARRNPDDGNHVVAPYPDVDTLWSRIPQGAVVIAQDWRVARQLPARGLFTVAPQWPSPGVEDAVERSEDQAAILNARSSPEVRDELLTRYGVAWIVWPTAKKLPAWLSGLGVPVDREHGQMLYELH
ncbi:hypothetical protein [Fodinibacter luteus]|uniref:hypothetical protein n=1 Tax=Fodinibacter luteus TaxID=552064 RepID=UPI0031E86444